MPHIVIEVPELSNTLYIASPFIEGDVDLIPDLEDDITIAASHADLVIRRRNPSTDALDQVLDDISCARVLVAICFIGRTSKAISPEVMFQLGFARSRGKPILALVSNGDHAYTFVDTRERFGLSLDEVKTDTLRERLRVAIDVAKNHTEPLGIIDNAYFPHMWASRRRNWLNDPDFFVGLVRALTVATVATRLLQQMIHAHIDPLLRAVDDIIATARYASLESDAQTQLLARTHECGTAWQQYSMNYDAE